MGRERRIKILFVIDYVDSLNGGTEAQLFHILRGLDRSRFKPFLCCLWPTPWMRSHHLPCDHAVLFSKLTRWFSSPLSIMRIRKFMRAGRFDIVHTFFPTSNVLAVLAARLARVRVILSSRRDLGYWKTWRDRVLLRAVRSIPTCYLANSHAVKRQLAATEGIDPSKIIVVHNGVDVDVYSQDLWDQAAAIKTKYSLPEDALIVGVIANYHRKVKGIDCFVEAARLVASEIENIFFFIVGYGRLEQERTLRCRIHEVGLDPHFVLTGQREDIRPFLSMFHVAVLPSLSEGFSNSLLEYMASGLASVACDVGGNREAIIDGESGFLAEPASPRALAGKIVLLLKDAALRERMGRQARNRARTRFSMKSMVRQLEGLYLNLYNSNSRPKKSRAAPRLLLPQMR